VKKRKRKVKKKSIITFWLLILVGIFVLIQFIVPILRGIIFLLPIGILFLLGIALIIFTIKDKIKGKLKFFLLLTGISSTSFFVSIILHNMFYAFAILSKNIILLQKIMEILHTLFFLIGIPLCPLGFLVGVVSTIILINRNKK